MVAVTILTKCGHCGNRGRLDAVLKLLNKPLTSCGLKCYSCEMIIGSIYMIKDTQQVIRHPIGNSLIGISYKFV